MDIRPDDLTEEKVVGLIREHLQSMALISPPESTHGLDVESLRKPDVTFWSAWEGEELVGCGALKELDGQHGEIKSMRTSSPHLRKGVARQVLQHIIEEAKQRGYRRLRLQRHLPHNSQQESGTLLNGGSDRRTPAGTA